MNLLEDKKTLYAIGIIGFVLLILLFRKSGSGQQVFGTVSAAGQADTDLEKARLENQTAQLKEQASYNLRLAELSAGERIAQLQSNTQIELAKIGQPSRELAQLQYQLNVQDIAARQRAAEAYQSAQNRNDLLNQLNQLSRTIAGALSGRSGSGSGSSGSASGQSYPAASARPVDRKAALARAGQWYTNAFNNLFGGPVDYIDVTPFLDYQVVPDYSRFDFGVYNPDDLTGSVTSDYTFGGVIDSGVDDITSFLDYFYNNYG